jgi:hypothetical protein
MGQNNKLILFKRDSDFALVHHLQLLNGSSSQPLRKIYHGTHAVHHQRQALGVHVLVPSQIVAMAALELGRVKMPAKMKTSLKCSVVYPEDRMAHAAATPTPVSRGTAFVLVGCSDSSYRLTSSLTLMAGEGPNTEHGMVAGTNSKVTPSGNFFRHLAGAMMLSSRAKDD